MATTKLINPDRGTASFLADPLDDPRLDAIPDSIRNQIVEVADAVLAEGHRPTPRLVADVMDRLKIPMESEWLTVTLMLHWRFRLDEIDPTDREALRLHLDRAPVIDHPWCHFLAGLLTGMAVGAMGVGRGRP